MCQKMLALVTPVMLEQDPELKFSYDILNSQSSGPEWRLVGPVFTYDPVSFNLTIHSHSHIFEHLKSMQQLLYKIPRNNRAACDELSAIIYSTYGSAIVKRVEICDAFPASVSKTRFQMLCRISSLFESKPSLMFVVFWTLENLSYCDDGRGYIQALSQWAEALHQDNKSLLFVSQSDSKENKGVFFACTPIEFFYLRHEEIEPLTLIGKLPGEYYFTFSHFILFQLYHMAHLPHGSEIPCSCLDTLYQKLHLRRLPACTFQDFYNGIKPKYL